MKPSTVLDRTLQPRKERAEAALELENYWHFSLIAATVFIKFVVVLSEMVLLLVLVLDRC